MQTITKVKKSQKKYYQMCPYQQTLHSVWELSHQIKDSCKLYWMKMTIKRKEWKSNLLKIIILEISGKNDDIFSILILICSFRGAVQTYFVHILSVKLFDLSILALSILAHFKSHQSNYVSFIVFLIWKQNQ